MKKKIKWEKYPRHDGKKELECEHGIGHGGIHGCDGCCADPSFEIAWKKIFKEAIMEPQKDNKPTPEEKCGYWHTKGQVCRKCGEIATETTVLKGIKSVPMHFPSPEARVDWEGINQLREVYDMDAHFDKINELVDAVNKLSASFEKGREAR